MITIVKGACLGHVDGRQAAVVEVRHVVGGDAVPLVRRRPPQLPARGIYLLCLYTLYLFIYLHSFFQDLFVIIANGVAVAVAVALGHDNGSLRRPRLP